MNDVTENDVLILYLPRIKQMCYGRWTNLEPEDRQAEAALFFLYMLRRPYLNCRYFWKEYCDALVPHMDHLNRIAPSRYFKECSLDCPINTKDFQGKLTLLDVLGRIDSDESLLYVKEFIKTLNQEDEAIVHDLEEGLSRASVARKHQISVYALKKRLNKACALYMEDAKMF